jgi:hypothetical protein
MTRRLGVEFEEVVVRCEARSVFGPSARRTSRPGASTAAGNAHAMATSSLQKGETAPLSAWWLGRASSPAAVREACTHGSHGGPTAGLADGFVQANLVIVPAEHAEHFREFCRLNPRPCPLLEELPPGERHTGTLADGADLTTCLPRYRVWRHGRAAEEVSDLRDLWRDDLCAFLLGCSFSFEQSLEAAGARLGFGFANPIEAAGTRMGHQQVYLALVLTPFLALALALAHVGPTPDPSPDPNPEPSLSPSPSPNPSPSPDPSPVSDRNPHPLLNQASACGTRRRVRTCPCTLRTGRARAPARSGAIWWSRCARCCQATCPAPPRSRAASHACTVRPCTWARPPRSASLRSIGLTSATRCAEPAGQG